MAEWSPERLQAELVRVGVGYAEIAECTHVYQHHVKRVVLMRERNRTVEECIARLIGASRLEVFGLNATERRISSVPTAEARAEVQDELKRRRISQSRAARMTGYSRVSVCAVLRGKHYYPRVWKALQTLVRGT